MKSTEDQQRVIFGCTLDELRAALAESMPVKLNAGGHPMVAMSMLSDAQELLGLGRAEQARKEINKAKWVIREHLSAPALKELSPNRYRIKVKGGQWHFSDRLPAPCDMESIEAIEEAGEQADLPDAEMQGARSRPRAK